MEKSIKFEISEEFNQGCASISFNWISEQDSKFSILMYFSNLIGGTKYNLELTFDSIVSMKYEEEMPGLIYIPKIPHCTKKYFTKYRYPIITIENSKWVKKYEKYRDNLTHYVFISMDDIVHVLTEERPKIKEILSDKVKESFDEKLNSLCTKVINKEIMFIDAICEITRYGDLQDMPEMKILNDIYNDIVNLPLGEQRKFWSAEALKQKESEITMHEKKARKKALHICKKLVK